VLRDLWVSTRTPQAGPHSGCSWGRRSNMHRPRWSRPNHRPHSLVPVFSKSPISPTDVSILLPDVHDRERVPLHHSGESSVESAAVRASLVVASRPMMFSDLGGRGTSLRWQPLSRAAGSARTTKALYCPRPRRSPAGRPVRVQNDRPPRGSGSFRMGSCGKTSTTSGSNEGPVAQLCPEIRIDGPAVQLLPSYSPLRASSRSSWCQSDWFATFKRPARRNAWL
jgi:hypothetical protein